MSSIWLPQIDSTRCYGCDACVLACPVGALELQEGKAALAQPDACTYCAACENVCPTLAIELPYLIIRLEMPSARDDAK